jgi:hypothetical protein
MPIRFEFDQVNKILLLRVDGQLTDELLGEVYRAIRSYSIATDAAATIVDLSGVTKFVVSSEFVRRLAQGQPAMPNTERPRIVVAPQTDGFGLVRMFHLVGEQTRPKFSAVKTMDEALRTLQAENPEFKPIELSSSLA